MKKLVLFLMLVSASAMAANDIAGVIKPVAGVTKKVVVVSAKHVGTASKNTAVKATKIVVGAVELPFTFLKGIVTGK